MVKTVLGESKSMIGKVLTNRITAAQDKEMWPIILGGLPKHNCPNKG